MGNDNHCHVLGGKLADNLENFPGKLRVKSACRLVKKEYLRLKSHCARNGNALLLSARKLAGIVFNFIRKSHFSEYGEGFLFNLCIDFLFVFLKIRAFLCLQLHCKGNVVKHIILRKKVELLENQTDFKLFFPFLLWGKGFLAFGIEDDVAVNGYFSLVRSFKKVDAAQQRCFSAARGTDD